jgi:hypothetical protein
VAVVTQEDSAMYVSYFNWETLEFEPEKGENVFYFPRSDACEVSRWEAAPLHTHSTASIAAGTDTCRACLEQFA